MHWSARLLPLLGVLACFPVSYPDYEVEQTNSLEPNSCHDGERSGRETSVDCGMLACGVPCGVGEGCKDNPDCDGGACEAGVCQRPTCKDALLNGEESDVDCGGGSCPRCSAEQRCRRSDDCAGRACTNGRCQVTSCTDQQQNGDETDVDCGGPSCQECEEGQSCLVMSDCDDVACEKGKCQPRACTDGVKNQTETDVDCGGNCPSPCADALRCKSGSDCASGVCGKQTLRCSPARCDDGVMNGTEPAIDCGASCTDKCGTLDGCASALDCASSNCKRNECLPTAATEELYLMQGWLATASHEFSSTTAASKAIDGSLITDWITGADQVPGMWIEIDMRERKVVFSVELVIENSVDAEDAPQAVDVWLSDDGTFTTPLVKNVPGAQVTRVDFSAPEVARYIKISTSAGTSKSRWWRVDELRVRQ